MYVWLIIIAILLAWLATPARMMVYRLGDRSKPQVTVIAGTHGNEPAPGEYLERLACHLKQHPEEVPQDVHLVIIPRVNPVAVSRGVRGMTVGGRTIDLNRCWPDSVGEYCSPIREEVDRSHLIVDFHEAWSFESRDTGSLGQTIYTSDTRLTPLIQHTIERLNRVAPEPWRAISALPVADGGGALDEYCVERRIPYILVEVAGQRDIVPKRVREHQCAVAIESLLGVKV